MYYNHARPHGCNMNCTTQTPSTFTFSQFCVINSPGIHHTAYPSLFRARLWFCASKSLLSPTLRSFWNSDDNSSLVIGLLSTHLSVFIQVLHLTNWFTWPGCCFVKKTVPWLCKLTTRSLHRLDIILRRQRQSCILLWSNLTCTFIQFTRILGLRSHLPWICFSRMIDRWSVIASNDMISSQIPSTPWNLGHWWWPR